MMMRTIRPCMGLLLMVLLATACGGAAPDTTSTDVVVKAELSTDAQDALRADANMLVPVQHVLEAVDAGVELVFVDARPALDYEFGHIPGALSIPYYDAAGPIQSLDPDKVYIAYCECPHAEAVQLADEMLAAGFSNVKVIDEGLYGWTQAGGEMVGGTAEPSAAGD